MKTLRREDVRIFGKLYIENTSTKNTENKNEIKLHFLVYNLDGPNGEKGFESVALELGIFCWSITPEDALNQVFEYSKILFQELFSSPKGFDQYLDELKNEELGSLWGVYRQISLLLGDPEREIHAELNQKLNQVEEENREHQEKIAEQKVDIDILKKALEEKKVAFAL